MDHHSYFPPPQKQPVDPRLAGRPLGSPGGPTDGPSGGPPYGPQGPRPPKRPRRRLSVFGLLTVILTALVVSGVVFFGASSLFPDVEIPLGPAGGKDSLVLRLPRPSGTMTDKILLVMGVDLNYDSRDRYSFKGVRTDTMMLVRVSPAKNTVSVISIPRDSKVFIGDGGRIDKINAAYAYGGAPLAIETVEKAFGVPIDNYVVVNARGVKDLVDAIGGVEVYVPTRMKYRDRTAGLNIDFEPGLVSMDGEQAEAFLRFRHDEMGDIGRITRQQQFMAALAKKFKNPMMLVKLPELIRLANENMDTNLSYNQMMQLAWFGKDLNLSQIRGATMPGEPSFNGISYWLIHPNQAEYMLDRLMLDNPGAETVIGEDEPLRVGVFYAPAVAEYIDTIEKRLEEQGFTVTCKIKRKDPSSRIVEHSRRVNDASTERLRRSMKWLGQARLIFAPAGTTFEANTCSAKDDYTVVIGDDIRRQSNG